MNYWRMSFRCGNRGYEMWEKCLSEEVAAITYTPFLYTDLSKHNHFEPNNKWKALAAAQYASLRRFVYEIKRDDVIFVKRGKYIYGKGVVSGKYKFVRNTNLICPNGKEPWCHHMPVKWEKDFMPIKLSLGAEQFTVKSLDLSQVNLILKQEEEAKKQDKKFEVSEGEKYEAEVTFRKRNRAIIEAKKLNSNGNCEVCGFNYSKFFKGFTKNHLVAHHLFPIALRKKSNITKLDDIALVCSNCHTAIHSENPMLRIDSLRRKLNRNIKW